MRKSVWALMALALVLCLGGIASAKNDKAAKEDKPVCTTIQSGELYSSTGDVLTTGYDEWGYNYQAMMFNGMWCDYHPLYRPGGAYHDWCIENYADVELAMKWNEGWLDNKDCDGDLLLDRYYGYDSYIGSGAWLTNHEKGTYVGDDGETCQYEYFVKIVAVPADAVEDDGIWYTPEGDEIGPEIWGAFATVQEVYNDGCAGEHGVAYKSDVSPGLGYYGGPQ